MFDAFGISITMLVEPKTFQEAAEGATAMVRVGERGDWVYAVEDRTSYGYQMLDVLSGENREAFALCYTQGISLFLYSRDGVMVNGFDMTVPHIRYGHDEHYFDDLLRVAGFADSKPATPAAGARLVQLAFGIHIDQDMLERPLPCAVVRPRPVNNA
jgi:hypothetical protein